MKKKSTGKRQKGKRNKSKTIWEKIPMGIILSILTLITTIVIYQKQDHKNTMEAENLRLKNLSQDSIIYHDKLYLMLGENILFDNTETNIDVINAFKKAKDHVLPLAISFINNGAINATNVKGYVYGDLPNKIFCYEPFGFKDDNTEVYEDKFLLKSIVPNELNSIYLMFLFSEETQMRKKTFRITATCDNKRKPIDVQINIRAYSFQSYEEYYNYIYSEYKTTEELNKYWKGNSNFTLFLQKGSRGEIKRVKVN